MYNIDLNEIILYPSFRQGSSKKLEKSGWELWKHHHTKVAHLSNSVRLGYFCVTPLSQLIKLSWSPHALRTIFYEVLLCVIF